MEKYSASSYSEGLSNKNEGNNVEERIQKLRVLNGILKHLAENNDLHERLADPLAEKALKHWTGINRLPPDESQKFMESGNINFIFERVRLLQGTCKACGMGFPLDHFLSRKKVLRPELVEKHFGKDCFAHPHFPMEDYQDIIENLLKEKVMKSFPMEDSSCCNVPQSTDSLPSQINLNNEGKSKCGGSDCADKLSSSQQTKQTTFDTTEQSQDAKTPSLFGMQGKSIWDYKDFAVKLFIQMLISTVLTMLFVEFVWPYIETAIPSEDSLL